MLCEIPCLWLQWGRRVVAIGGGQWCSGARSPIRNLCPLIWCLSPGCYIHSILYLKNVAPLVAFGPPCCNIPAMGL